MNKVKLYHPILGKTIEVAERAVWVHLQSDWVFAADDATNDETNTEAIDAEQALDALSAVDHDGDEEEPHGTYDA